MKEITPKFNNHTNKTEWHVNFKKDLHIFKYQNKKHSNNRFAKCLDSCRWKIGSKYRGGRHHDVQTLGGTTEAGWNIKSLILSEG